MSDRVEEAYRKLKNMALFSEDDESFIAMFDEMLHEGKEADALRYVLRVTHRLLRSHGETFNEVLEMVDESKTQELIAWLGGVRGRL